MSGGLRDGCKNLTIIHNLRNYVFDEMYIIINIYIVAKYKILNLWNSTSVNMTV